jgi:hypothetical protein
MKKTFILSAAVLMSLSLSQAGIFVVEAQTPTPATTNSGPEFGAPTDPQYTLLAPLPCIPASAPGCVNGTQSTVDIKTYIVYIFELAIAVAVFLAVVMITWGGFRYMTEESVTKKGAAKEIIQNAVWGLLGALASYLILYTINPQLVNLNLISVPTLELNNNANVGLNPAAFNASLQAGNKLSINNAINQNAAAAAAQQSYQSTLNDLNVALDSSGCLDTNGNYIGTGDPQCDDLENQYASTTAALNGAVSQQNTQKAVVGMVSAESTFNTNINVHDDTVALGGGRIVSLGNTSLDDAQTALQSIDNTYTQTYNGLPNGDVVDKTLLAGQYTYSTASVINDYNTNTAIAALDYDINNTASRVSGESKTLEIQNDIASAQTLIQNLTNNSIPNQINGSTVQIGNLNSSPDLQNQYKAANQIRINGLQMIVQAAQSKITN